MVAIQWYPGHMTKARKVLAEKMPSQDVIIEVLDARMPESSANPVVTELRRDIPCVKVLSKSDLADPAVTREWVDRIGTTLGRGKTIALATRTDRGGEIRAQLGEACNRIVSKRSGPGKTIRAMIVGIPNVGKSTLINTLMDRKVAKAEDKPAVTKATQTVVLKNGMTILDNPGIMWPKIEDEKASLRLALGGAIPDSAIDRVMVALFGAGFFLENYPELILARYKLEKLPESPTALLDEIGRKRGCLMKGGGIDVYKAADVLIHEYRSGTLGLMSLERPINSFWDE